MSISTAVAKKRLSIVWFTGSGLLFLLFLVQTWSGKYADKTAEAWGWLLPTFMPTLLLITGVLVADAKAKRIDTGDTHNFLFWLTFNLSCVYLLIVIFTILLSPFFAATPLNLMKLSNLGLGPLQGVVAGTLGAFFVNEK